MNFNYQDAKLSLNFARAIDPDNNRLHLWFGKVYAATGKFKEAVKELRMHGMLYPTDIKAKIELANCYLMTDDYKKAASWFRKAAESGHEVGQAFLAMCYENGLGVAKDMNAAVEWYKMSARQGFDDAIKWLNERGIQYA